MNDRADKFFGLLLKNTQIFQQSRAIGFDYILNPETNELHKCLGGRLWGSHDLIHADLEKFIGLTNIGLIPVDRFEDGTRIPVYDLISGEFIGEYSLNKCQHCFPN
jgi:hypothetical protein